MHCKIINKACYLISYSIFILSISLLTTACPTPPEFEDVPKIEYENIEFSQISDTTTGGQILNQDLISLTIFFEDGDGDLGLRSSELDPPYHLFDIPVDQQGELIFFGSSPELPSFSFYDYYITPDSAIINNTLLTNDTILVDFNERYFNIFVSFYRKLPGSNEFEQFEWETEPNFYQTFHGRFPILNTEDYSRPLNGSLTYEMKSAGFSFIFRDYEMYLEAYILDRAGNRSNTIRTETIRLLNPE